MDIAQLESLAQNLKGNLVKVDWTSLQGQLGDLAQKAILPVIDGEGDDLKRFSFDIGRDMVVAIMNGNMAWQEQLNGQLKILAEKGRLRSTGAGWDLAQQGLALVFHAAVAGLGAAIPKP